MTGGTKMRTWFAVENSLVDRNDLSAYEKLCAVVLARYAGRPEFDHLLTTDIIAVKMGVSSNVALEALRGLVAKGLIDADSTSDLFVEGSDNHIKDIELQAFREPEQTSILRNELGEAYAQPIQFEDLDESQADGFNKDLEKATEDDFDNLDRLIEEAKAMSAQKGEQTLIHESAFEPKLQAEQASEASANKPAPYSRGLASYQTDKTMRSVKNQSPEAKEKEEIKVDPEVLNRSIHEQSDSVRAWIEESESAGPLISKSPISDKEQLVEDVMAMIDEPINDRQARIILGLAEYDLNRVQKCYLVAQNTQVSDKIDMLIHELQKKEAPAPPKRVPRTSQVDHVRLDQMKKYQAMKNNK